MPWSELHYLPLLAFILLPSTFVICYVIAILFNHVSVIFPYISDTGTHVPESNIFAQALNMVACLVGIIVYIRYKHVEQHYRDGLTPSANIFIVNRFAIIFGLFASIGLSVVANFREIELFKIHMFGAMMAFGFGSIYCWSQSFLSYSMVPQVNTRLMAHWRTTLSVIMTISFLVTCVLGQISIRQFHGKDPTNWKPDDGGYQTHILSAIFEWIAAMALDFFILSYTKEFQTFTITTPRVVLLETINVAETFSTNNDGTIYDDQRYVIESTVHSNIGPLIH